MSAGSELQIKISFDTTALRIQEFRQQVDIAIQDAVKMASQALLRDCRPFIPMLTGKLRDSGKVQMLQDYAFKLVWDAANIRSGYIYAEIQYRKILQHIDGRYAAKWVEKTLQANQGRYEFLVRRWLEYKLRQAFETGGL